MTEYHKIQSVFMRDPANNHKTFLTGQWTLPEFGYLANNDWIMTEKVDGTNMRVYWDGSSVRFGGRTDNAQIPAFLYDKMVERFPAAKMLEVFGDRGGLTLYGEGYGAKIQKGGGLYIADGCDFILFDILGGDMWFERSAVEIAGAALGIPVAPIVAVGSLYRAIDMTAAGMKSTIGTAMSEGLVCRPAVELRTRAGHRVITKVKTKDFAAVAKAA